MSKIVRPSLAVSRPRRPSAPPSALLVFDQLEEILELEQGERWAAENEASVSDEDCWYLRQFMIFSVRASRTGSATISQRGSS